MAIAEEKVKDFENKYKSDLFAKLSVLSEQQAELIGNVQTMAEFANIHRQLPNIAITLNNKIIELSHDFTAAGISMFSKKTENYGLLGLNFVGPSFIGEALMENVAEIMVQGNEFLGEYEQAVEKTLEKKQTQSQELQKAGPIKRGFLRLRGLIMPSKKIDYSFTKEEAEQLDSFLFKYCEKDQQLFGYNMRDNIVTSLVKYIRQKGYSKNSIPGLLEECVISDLEKLGLSDLIPQLNEQLEKAFAEEQITRGKPGELSPELRRKIQQDQQQRAEAYTGNLSGLETDVDITENSIGEQE